MLPPWSTHRDVVGAITDPWIDATRLAHALGRPPRRFATFVALATRFGWDAAAVAQVCGTTASTIRKPRAALDLGPAALCLGDARLRALGPRR